MNANFWDSVILITSSDSDRDENFGTGFVIHQDKNTTYLLTCAHVVNEVGGRDKVKVDGYPATVEVEGNRYGCDLAVLAVKEKLTKLPSLRLGVVGEKGRQFSATGFYTDATKTRKLAPIKGHLSGVQRIDNKEGDRTNAWSLLIDDDSEHELQGGYSGSPVVDLESGYVLGVVAQQKDKSKGLAISIEALKKIWDSMPFDLLKTDNVISEPGVDHTRSSDTFTGSKSQSPLNQVELHSDRGIDYSKLRELLANEQWKQADRETEILILEAAGRNGNLLNVESIQKLPCSDLRTIDRLWVKASQGHFGFSVQKQIWEYFGNNTNTEYELYCQFGNHVGWRKHGRWLWYEDMTFNVSAPKGHLPQWGLEAVLLGKTLQWKLNEFLMSQGGLKERVFSEFFSRIKTCNL